MVVAGHCACNKIQFEIDAPEAELSNGALCHCDTCYRAHSGPSYNMKLNTSSIKVIKGEPKEHIYIGGNSGQNVHRMFCGDCGSPLWSNPDSQPGVSYFKPGTLVDRSKVKLNIEIYSEHAAPGLLHKDGNVMLLDSNFQPYKA